MLRKLIFVSTIYLPSLLSAQNSYPSTGTTVLNAGNDQTLILKDGRSGINWNYMEWQFSDGSRDWVMGRQLSTGNFTLWRNGVNDVLTVDNNGKVGIGATSPGSKLEVAGPSTGSGLTIFAAGGGDVMLNANGSLFFDGVYNYNSGNYIRPVASNTQAFFTSGVERFRITSSGNVGIGTTSPDGFQVNTSLTSEFSQSASNIRMGMLGGTPRLIFDYSGSTPIEMDNNAGRLRIFKPGTELFTINSSGNVGIGTSSPDYPLTVNGSIHAKEVRVDLSVPGPDYVFANDYKLPSLEEIKNYIDENKHLPEVPSAAAMEKNGVQLGEMNMLLLKKIEELTLYVIELKKENQKFEQQGKEIQVIKEELESLKKSKRK